MGIYSFYNSSTGVFRNVRYTGPDELLALNTPDNSTPILGEYDSLRQKYDLTTGKIVPYQPPAPSDTTMFTWSWDGRTETWVRVPTLKAVQMDHLQNYMRPIRDVKANENYVDGSVYYINTEENRSAVAVMIRALEADIAAGDPDAADISSYDTTTDELVTQTKTLAQMKTLLRQLNLITKAAMVTARTIRTNVEAATTAEQVRSYRWPPEVVKFAYLTTGISVAKSNDVSIAAVVQAPLSAFSSIEAAISAMVSATAGISTGIQEERSATADFSAATSTFVAHLVGIDSAIESQEPSCIVSLDVSVETIES